MNPWRARCRETCSAGSEGGSGKRIGGNVDTAPRSDPYSYREDLVRQLQELADTLGKHLSRLSSGSADAAPASA